MVRGTRDLFGDTAGHSWGSSEQKQEVRVVVLSPCSAQRRAQLRFPADGSQISPLGLGEGTELAAPRCQS